VHGVGRRRWLSAFFVIHWLAVALYLLPATKDALEPLPGWLESAGGMVFPRAVRWTSPVTVPYLDLTGVRQHWTLFAPHPASWAPTIKVVPYFGVDGEEAWLADTVTIQGPREQRHPHVLHHRTHRVLFNLGYESWGRAYRTYFAQGLCRTLADSRGRSPDGIELISEWHRIRIPWDQPTEAEVYTQRLGGFDCASEDGDRGAPWRAYGIPDRLATEGWPRVEALPDGYVQPTSEPVH
jgi:hypothetical protein